MSKFYYEINKNGKIIGAFEQAPQLNNSHTIIHTTPPPPTMLKPCWIANKWTETATKTEQEEHIDQETDNTIKTWCRNKGKCEEYYINCGIKVAMGNITDTTNTYYRHYQEYQSYRDTQVKIGKQKKAALNV